MILRPFKAAIKIRHIKPYFFRVDQNTNLLQCSAFGIPLFVLLLKNSELSKLIKHKDRAQIKYSSTPQDLTL